MSTSKEINRKILDEVRDVMRLKHYSIHTERSYCGWIKRFIKFHQMKSRDDLTESISRSSSEFFKASNIT